jgi:hypothetical protein
MLTPLFIMGHNQSKAMKKWFLRIISLSLMALVLTGCGQTTKPAESLDNPQAAFPSGQPAEATAPKAENKLCDWVDASDVIIKVNFADGVAKDTSNEAGFYYSSVKSNMRVARSGCDYRTGFSYDELKNLGAVEVGVRGYTDSRRRQIVGEPISVVLGADGVPNIGSRIEVTITD